GARPLVHVVAGAVALDHDAELHGAVPSGIDVEAVVAGAGDHQVARAVRAAEELHAVVGAVVDLDVLQRGAAADAAGGQALELVPAGEGEARVADLHVLHGARVVGGRVAAVHAQVAALDAGFALRAARLEVADAGIDRRPPGKHQATPAAFGLGIGVALDVDLRGHDDRLFRGSKRIDPGAAVDHQRIGAGRGVDGHAGLDVEDALARAGPRRRGVAAHVLAHVHGAIDRVDGAFAPGNGELADDAFGQLAGAQVGDRADIAEAIRAAVGGACARRRGRRRGGRRRGRSGRRRRRERAFAWRCDAVGTAAAGAERDDRAEGHEEGLGTVAHGHLVVSRRKGPRTRRW